MDASRTGRPARSHEQLDGRMAGTNGVDVSRLARIPPAMLLASLRLRLQGRVHFPRDRVGDTVEGGTENYRVFRVMVVDPPTDRATAPQATLEVGFRFKRFSPAVNRWLSRLPMPFIAVQPGFRSKTWMVGEKSGAFRGVYAWSTADDAERYGDSFPMRMMKRRAEPGTLIRRISAADSIRGDGSGTRLI